MPVVDSTMYLVPVDGSCLVVDPCVSEEAGELLRNLKIQDCLVFLTHEHYDHISGVNWLREQMPCWVVCSENCARRIVDPKKNLAAYFNAITLQKCEAEQEKLEECLNPEYSCQADQVYTGQMAMRWRDITLTLREAPGHSPGSQIIEIGRRCYFTGDSLIPGTSPVTNLPGGNRKLYNEKTRPYLETITKGSILFPGHGVESAFDGSIDGFRKV